MEESKLREIMRSETLRITEELKSYNLRERGIYLKAYADALEYAYEFLTEESSGIEKKLE